MPIKVLDETTKKAINDLSPEDISRERSYAFEHELLWYGVDALVHYHLMCMARAISEGGASVDEFIRQFGLSFDCDKFNDPTFRVKLKIIENSGIFIPQQNYSKPDTEVWLFDSDYRNRIRHDIWIDKVYADALTRRRWQPLDLQSSELVEQGMRFGRDMWRTCVYGFNKYKNGTDTMQSQPKHVTELGEKLVGYYSSIVFNQP